MPTVKKIKSQSIISIRVIASINQSINRSLHQLGRWSLSLSLTWSQLILKLNWNNSITVWNMKHNYCMLNLKKRWPKQQNKNQIKHTTAGRLMCYFGLLFISFSSWILLFWFQSTSRYHFDGQKKWLNEMKWMEKKKSKKIKYNLPFFNLPRSFSRIKIVWFFVFHCLTFR